MSRSRDGGEAVVDWMVEQRISVCFTVPGESFLPVLESLEHSSVMTVVNRHESAVAFAAEAYGKITGRPAMCMVTRGPGAANLSIGVQTALYDGTPLMALVGQVPTEHLESRGFQGVDLDAYFRPISKSATTVRSRSQLSGALQRAYNMAVRPRCGPSVVTVPEDVLNQEYSDKRVDSPGKSPVTAISGASQLIIDALCSADRPSFVSALPAVRGEGSRLLSLIGEVLEVPVFAAWRRWSSVDSKSRAFIGGLGLGAPRAISEHFAQSDLVIGFGLADEEITLSRLGVSGSRCRVLIIDNRHDNVRLPSLADGVEITLINADPVETLAQLYYQCCSDEFRRESRLKEWLRTPLDMKSSLDRAQVNQNRQIGAEGSGSSNGVDMDLWASTLDSAMPEDAILVSDAGNFSQWILKHVSFGHSRIYLGPTNGAMGYGLPGALGASMARPATRVWAVCGDGGLGMTLGELETVARLGRNVALIVVNNQAYGTIKSHQEARYGTGHASASDLGPVDFAEVAKGMGWRGVTVDQDGDLADAFQECASNSGPYLIQVMSQSRPLTAWENSREVIQCD